MSVFCLREEHESWGQRLVNYGNQPSNSSKETWLPFHAPVGMTCVIVLK